MRQPQSLPALLAYAQGAFDIVAVKDGGTDDPNNLRLLCQPCHKGVTAEQQARWAAAKRERAALHKEGP